MAAGGVWAIYWLFLFIKKGNYINLYLAASLLSILVLGKQTNLYLVFSFISVLLWLWFSKIIDFKTAVLVGVMVFWLPAMWYSSNFVETGNPVFPFYNSIFKSKYFEPVSFHEPQFGGIDLWQRVAWGWYSVFDPLRLGQVHDLFNDYKVNIYWLVAILVLVFRRWKIAGFYLIIFTFWGVMFGYLRYGLILEYLGGLMLMLIYARSKNAKWKYFVFIPIFIILIVQNKRIINFALAYDIAFRPGYFYNRQSYLKNSDRLWAKKLDVVINNNFKPAIYLNCAVGGMSYYVLSPFSNLPVVNIDQRAYPQMTNNHNYIEQVKKRLVPYLGQKQLIEYVTIAANGGMNTEYESCVSTLRKKSWKVLEEENVSFLGYEPQSLVVIYGYIDPKDW